MLSLLVSAIVQGLFAVLLAGFFWVGHRGIAFVLKRDGQKPWVWSGLVRSTRPARLPAFFCAFLVAGVLGRFALHHWMGPLGDGSDPILEVANLGSLPLVLVGAVLYGVVKTGFSEELFFRGVVGRRFISWFGFKVGNTLQALLFVGVHHLAFAAVGAPVLGHAVIFVLVFPMAWLGGWLNDEEGSILPSWSMHAGANVGSVLATWWLL
jgi:membrane protease YdiL (CAAX protease family)